MKPLGARRRFDRKGQFARHAVAACPGCDEIGRDLGRDRLRLVVPVRPHQLRRAGDGAVETADEQSALGHQQHPLPVTLQHAAGGRAEPAEAAAGEDRGLGRIAQIGEFVIPKIFRRLDCNRRHQGRQARKLASSIRPVLWLFSG